VAKTAAKAETTTEEVVVGPDLYGWFIGAFVGLLSLIVLVSTGSILSVLVLLALIALLVSSLVYYGFLDLSDYLEDKVTPPPPVVPAAKPAGGPLLGSEVFHIDGGPAFGTGFTYDEAPAVCAAFDSEIATLEQVMEAYSKGAEWCNYGWTAGGMALYPTQKDTWDQLQRELDIERRTRCGRPGVNGGYMDPLLKLGVNCYGFKPKGDFNPPAPVPGGDPQGFKDMVNRFKSIMKQLAMAPFSRYKWSAARPEGFRGSMSSDTSYGTQFRQSFTTPQGVVEHIVNGDGSDPYVEETTTSGGYGGAPYGLVGAQGEAGPQGQRGIQGLRGAVGPQGTQGPQGQKGDRGAEGAASTVPGPTGATGSKGDQGEKGDKGATGADGKAAAKGENGADGKDGKDGKDGINGKDGAAGAPGERGPTGQAQSVAESLVDELIGRGMLTNFTKCYINWQVSEIAVAYPSPTERDPVNFWDTRYKLCEKYYKALGWNDAEYNDVNGKIDTLKPQYRVKDSEIRIGNVRLWDTGSGLGVMNVAAPDKTILLWSGVGDGRIPGHSSIMTTRGDNSKNWFGY
jgi:hypothetical protein